MNNLEKVRLLINELESRKVEAKIEIGDFVGTLNYYLKMDSDSRNRNRKKIEKLLIEKENVLINIENTERKIMALHNEKFFFKEK